MRVGLVGCVKQKQHRPARARDLYVSDLFVKRRAYVERTCDRWYILSALHGLVDPDDLLEPYDRTLKQAGSAERRGWSNAVLAELDRRLGTVGDHTFELHAGAEYRDFGLVQGLRGSGATVENPTAGLGIGQQLSFYKHALEE